MNALNASSFAEAIPLIDVQATGAPHFVRCSADKRILEMPLRPTDLLVYRGGEDPIITDYIKRMGEPGFLTCPLAPVHEERVLITFDDDLKTFSLTAPKPDKIPFNPAYGHGRPISLENYFPEGNCLIHDLHEFFRQAPKVFSGHKVFTAAFKTTVDGQIHTDDVDVLAKLYGPTCTQIARREQLRKNESLADHYVKLSGEQLWELQPGDWFLMGTSVPHGSPERPNAPPSSWQRRLGVFLHRS